MSKTKLKRGALANLIAGYILIFCFALLIIINRNTEATVQTVEIADVPENKLFNSSTPSLLIEPTVIDRRDRVNYGRQITLERGPSVVIDEGNTVAVAGTRSHVVFETDLDRHIYQDELRGKGIYNKEIIHGDLHSVNTVRGNHGGVHSLNDGVNVSRKDAVGDVDLGLLDRRLADLNSRVDLDTYNKAIRDDRDKIGIDKEDSSIDLAGLTLARKGDDIELGDLDELNTDFNQNKKGYGLEKGGELYAYNFPSRGVGAGIGSSAIGAGAGGGAGLGAGIGEGMLNGESVPTLGGVGDGAKSIYGEPAGPAGVGGLVGGAGAGGAAGLTQGYITEKLGLGIEKGAGKGAGYGAGGRHNYDHLPRDGALHIMMHVDGSGSILNTRKQLDIMKATLLKDALLPYYNNDESLYNNRVSIIANSGERTLKFFSKAAERENVLAVAFQDEAQPCYHLPNFNRKPEGDYLDDLKVLKSKLNSHDGIYRGIMFQVDRGKTFAKSFKEFVGNAFQGKGYLKNQNLKQYYWQSNFSNIKHKKGVVFSDEYHAKDEGDPQYYLNLLFNASRKVGLDLDIYGGGLKDGKHNPTRQ